MIIIGNGRLVTRDKDQPFIENGAVALDGQVIARVGTAEELKREFPDARRTLAGAGIARTDSGLETFGDYDIIEL